MTINASASTVAAVTKVLTLAALLDDRAPHPDKARIAAWVEQVERHRLDLADLLDGVRDFYDHPRDRPIGVGDLIQHARRVRRARMEREDDAAERRARDAYNAALAASNKARLDEITGTFGTARAIDRPRTATPGGRSRRNPCLEAVQRARRAAPAATIHQGAGDPLLCGLGCGRELVSDAETGRGACDRCWPTVRQGGTA
jgi:hypothetical protein